MSKIPPIPKQWRRHGIGRPGQHATTLLHCCVDAIDRGKGMRNTHGGGVHSDFTEMLVCRRTSAAAVLALSRLPCSCRRDPDHQQQGKIREPPSQTNKFLHCDLSAHTACICHQEGKSLVRFKVARGIVWGVFVTSMLPKQLPMGP